MLCHVEGMTPYQALYKNLQLNMVSKNQFGDSMGAARAVEESHVEILYSQQTNTASHLECIRLVDFKSNPA